jgi:hypothetical protein
MKNKNTKRTPKTYDAWVKQTYLWAIEGQPTPCPLQNVIDVFK